MLKKRLHTKAGAAVNAAPAFLFWLGLSGALAGVSAISGCTTLPEPKLTRYAFPKSAYVNAPEKRPYEKLGQVRSKVNFNSLNARYEENVLCRNFYNKAVGDLIKIAQEQGGDAVIDVKSVVFMMDGSHELHAEPECSDDGAEGQILVQGIAIKWSKPKGARHLLVGGGESRSGAFT